jgi:Uri superfamily endonuclease
MAMDLPEAKGTYVLIAFVAQMKRLEIGRLGAYDIVPGYYAYVGSAFGAGGLRARIGHHLESTATPHWHIDYLLGVAEPIEVWYTRADKPDIYSSSGSHSGSAWRIKNDPTLRC